jgi:UDP-2,3-diacylglucosamine pyrophosphatase LpxH
VKNKYLILSDIHLGSKDCKPKTLLKVLRKYKAKTIIIAGDLFDHHNLHRLCKTHWKVLSRLRKISKKCKVIYLIGNHCFLKAEFMSILLGFKCKNEHIINLNEEKILVVHGDIFDIFFTKYKHITNFIIKCYYFLRKFTPYADDIFQLFYKKNMSFIEKNSKVKQNALNYIEMNEYDKIICGHTHNPEQEKKYINTGSFCEQRCSFVVIDKEGIKLIYAN